MTPSIPGSPPSGPAAAPAVVALPPAAPASVVPAVAPPAPLAALAPSAAVPAPTLGFGDPSVLLSPGGGLGGFAAYDPGLLLGGVPAAPGVTRVLAPFGPSTVTYAARLDDPARATVSLTARPVAVVALLAVFAALAVRRATLRRASRRGR